MSAKDTFDADGPPKKDRRSGLDRRWIKAPYKGQDRRSGRSRRRQSDPPKHPFLPLSPPPGDSAGLEKLLVSASLQLEAVTRLLLKNGLISQEDLHRVIAEVQAEYHDRNEM